MLLKSRKVLFCSLLIVLSKDIYSASPDVINNPLQQFVNQIWIVNPSIQSQKASVNAARFRAEGKALPLYNPSLQAQADQTDTTNYTVGVSQTLDVSGKRLAQAQVGATDFRVAQTQLDILRLEVGIKALKALAEYNTNQRIVNLAIQKTQLLKEFVNQVAKKHQAGDVSRVQLDEANMVLAEAISQQAAAEEALSLSKETLNALSSNQNISYPILPKKLPIKAELQNPTDTLTQLPQLQLLNEEVAKAQANVNVARSQTHGDPTVSVYGGKDEEGQKLVGATINVPLFIRNNYSAGVGQANNELIAIEKSRMDTYQSALATLKGSFTRYQIASEAYQQWQATSEKSLQDGKVLLNKLWEAGELSTTDYLIQIKQIIDSQVAGARLQGEAWNAWFAWLAASNRLNDWLDQQG